MLIGPTKWKHFIHTYNKKIIFLITMQYLLKLGVIYIKKSKYTQSKTE